MAMRSKLVSWLIVLQATLALPAIGYAQEASFTGTVTDSTGGVLPGVTVTATNVESGNTFVAVSDERGIFRLPVRIGNFRITAELAGFTTVNQSLQMLVGQTTVVNFQMAPSTVQETVTVTGEAPLVDTTTSTVGSNIDPRQMSELPLNGRNWMDLSLLAPGARRNEGGGMVQFRQGYSQTNVDGQQMTVNYHSQTDSEQPGFSRDAIAEFEVVANRFDATMALLRHDRERHHQVRDEQLRRHGWGLLPGRQVQRKRLYREAGSPVLESTGEWDPRRPDPAGPDPFLRQLRIRAPANDLFLLEPVPELQR